MKRLLSGLLAMAISMNAGLLNTCNAMQLYNEYNSEYEFNVNDDDRFSKAKDENAKSETTKLIITDERVCFNKAKDEVVVERKKPNFLLSLVKKVIMAYVTCMSVKLISDANPKVAASFNSHARFIKNSSNYIKQKIDDFVKNNEWIQSKKAEFINSEFYKVLIDDGLLSPNLQDNVSGCDAKVSRQDGEKKVADNCEAKIA